MAALRFEVGDGVLVPSSEIPGDGTEENGTCWVGTVVGVLTSAKGYRTKRKVRLEAGSRAGEVHVVRAAKLWASESPGKPETPKRAAAALAQSGRPRRKRIRGSSPKQSRGEKKRREAERATPVTIVVDSGDESSEASGGASDNNDSSEASLESESGAVQIAASVKSKGRPSARSKARGLLWQLCASDNESDKGSTVATADGVEWIADTRKVDPRCDGKLPALPKVMLIGGQRPSTASAHDFFRSLFVATAFARDIVQGTSINLVRVGQPPLEGLRELFKFFGLLLLHPAYADYTPLGSEYLWRKGLDSGLVRAPNLGRFGMSRKRFDKLKSCFSLSPAVAGSRRALDAETAQPLFNSFNTRRERNFRPGPAIIVDQPMCKRKGKIKSKWRKSALGGDFEIVTAFCAKSMVIVRAKLAGGNGRHRIKDGTAAALDLCEPYAGSRRTIIANSRIASVGFVTALGKMGLFCIGAIKAKTRSFPIKYLRDAKYRARGSTVHLHARVDDQVVFATGWKGSSKVTTFVSNCSSAQAAEPEQHRSSRQGSEKRPKKPVPRTKDVAEFQAAVDAVERHSCEHQSMLALEHSVMTKNTALKLFCAILGFAVVDSFQAAVLARAKCANDGFRAFVLSVAKALIENDMDDTVPQAEPRAAGVQEDEPAPADHEPPAKLAPKGLGAKRVEHVPGKHRVTALKKINAEYDLGISKPVQLRCSSCPPGARELASLACMVCTQAQLGNLKLSRKTLWHIYALCDTCRVGASKTSATAADAEATAAAAATAAAVAANVQPVWSNSSAIVQI